MTRVPRSIRVVLALGVLGGWPLAIAAQAPLVARWRATLSPAIESWSLADPLVQPGLTPSPAVRGASQRSVALAVRGAVGDRVVLDMTTGWADGAVDVGPQGGAGATVRLSGPTDVRVRTTTQLVRDRVLLTLGGTLPTGRTEYAPAQLAVARVLGAPAFGVAVPVLGLGGGVTGGLVFARPAAEGRWALATGLSYEHRAGVTPITVGGGLVAPDFSPSAVVRWSAGADGLVGAHGLTLNVGADLFADDRLTLPRTGDTPARTVRSRLGPVLTADVEWRVATTRLRELTVYAVERYRARFSRDGATIDGSDGHYLDAGVRLGIPAARGVVQLVLGARWQSGLDFEATLPTAGARLGTVELRWAPPTGALSAMPWVRLQAGTVTSGATAVRATGIAAGLAIGGAR